ncbi:MAG: hypothetical protein R2708_19680 [Vicinamibacterales bacterium]
MDGDDERVRRSAPPVDHQAVGAWLEWRQRRAHPVVRDQHVLEGPAVQADAHVRPEAGTHQHELVGRGIVLGAEDDELIGQGGNGHDHLGGERHDQRESGEGLHRGFAPAP